MRTLFTEEQLADRPTARSEKILRSCVHCGFCQATCPTYALTGDELDSPRGRIYLIKDMLENDRPADAKTVKHIDRCLSCLACVTTCPSDVDYMHLVDHARSYIEKSYKRPLFDRVLRSMLARVLPNRGLFEASMRAAMLTRPLHGLLRGRLAALAKAAPKAMPKPSTLDAPGVKPARGARRLRVLLLAGCVQRSLEPEINAATIRLLTRFGVEVIVAEGAGCCGALAHHLGREEDAIAAVKRNVDAWCEAAADGPIDAIIANASGCGTMLKDYGHVLADDDEYAEKAERIATLAKDVSEILLNLDLAFPERATGLTVAYHSACSMQHGQKITAAPKALLEAAGFGVVEPAESHMCCGSAGAYSFLQPEMAGRLRERKARALEKTEPDVVASGNVGCITHLRPGLSTDILHTVQLLDWASGGPDPRRKPE
ncbi:MAG: glycolate oxidase subunit GlcF [Pseudomonadota bacterium]